MSKSKPIPYRKQPIVENTTNDNWSDRTPFEPAYVPCLGGPVIGHHVKTCKVNSLGKTIFLPEWYHGNL